MKLGLRGVPAVARPAQIRPHILMPRPSPEVLAAVRAAGGRIVFVDLGAGMYDAGGRTPGAVNGSSLHWFSAAFEARGAPFDEVLAFEARELRAKKLCAALLKIRPSGQSRPDPQS